MVEDKEMRILPVVVRQGLRLSGPYHIRHNSRDMLDGDKNMHKQRNLSARLRGYARTFTIIILYA